jgi:transposase
LIDLLDTEISGIERQLRALGVEHRYIPLLITCPGIAWVLAFTITSELGDISRFPTPTKFVGYSGLCPRSTSPVNATGAARCAKTGPTTCAGCAPNGRLARGDASDSR